MKIDELRTRTEKYLEAYGAEELTYEQAQTTSSRYYSFNLNGQEYTLRLSDHEANGFSGTPVNFHVQNDEDVEDLIKALAKITGKALPAWLAKKVNAAEAAKLQRMAQMDVLKAGRMKTLMNLGLTREQAEAVRPRIKFEMTTAEGQAVSLRPKHVAKIEAEIAELKTWHPAFTEVE